MSFYNIYLLPTFYLLAVFMASALILAIVRFDHPSYREVLGAGTSKLSRGIAWCIWLMDYILYFTGVLTAVAGIGIILLYINRTLKPIDTPTGDGSILPFRIFIDNLNYMLGGIGAGFTVYAVGFAVVTLIGKRADYRADNFNTVSPAFSKLDLIKLDIALSEIATINRILVILKRSVVIIAVCGVLLAAFVVPFVLWREFFH